MMSGKRAFVAFVSSLSLITVLLVRPLSAHEIRPAIADIEITGGQVVLNIDLTLEPMVAGIDVSAIFDTNDSPLAARHDLLRALEPAELERELRAAWPELSKKMRLFTGDTRLPLTLVGIEIAPIGDLGFARDSVIELRTELPPGDAPVTFGWASEFGPLVLRQVSDDPETAYTAYLINGQISDPIARSGGSQQSWILSFTNYIQIGFVHIVPRGLDHILFVLGLFFFSLNLRPLLWQVSAFTLAHTFSLALATLGVVEIPVSIVEPLIAASIIYVAVENIFHRRYNQWRTAVVFGFGLLHGLGFASVLGDIGLEAGRFATGLIGFNVGVELGQLAVIAAAFLLVGVWAGRHGWYRRIIATPASALIAVTGGYWFIERTFL